jgi:hypothetical protein
MFLVDYVLAQVYINHRSIIRYLIERIADVGPRNRENIILPLDYQMDDFDPYADPKFDFDRTESPPAPRVQGTSRQAEAAPPVEFQDVDPHVTLSFNGLLPTLLRDDR